MINHLRLNYTGEMEKAMHGAHGVGYEVYQRKHDVRMMVEKRREEDYQKSLRIIEKMVRLAHS